VRRGFGCSPDLTPSTGSSDGLTANGKPVGPLQTRRDPVREKARGSGHPKRSQKRGLDSENPNRAIAGGLTWIFK